MILQTPTRLAWLISLWLVIVILTITVNAGGSPGGGALAIFSSNHLKKTNSRNGISNSNPFENQYDKNKFNQQDSYNPYNSYKQYIMPRSPIKYNSNNCPSECTCKGLSIDCSNRNLVKVPENIPKNVIRVDLQGNQLTFIKNEDFSYLRNLKVLHLQKNRIEAIENKAFENLENLERVRLNNNQITYLPADLLKNLKSLKRLDLSYNLLKSITKQLFSSLTYLNNLQIDNNQIKCIEKGSFDSFKKISILRIKNNNLECNCKITWLTDWLIKNPNLALKTTCTTRRESNVQVEVKKFNYGALNCQLVKADTLATCDVEASCPLPCKCDMNLIDCKEAALVKIPENIANTTIELYEHMFNPNFRSDLKKNMLTEIPSGAFEELKNLRLLDLSNNQIESIHSDSFAGLTALNTLILFRNELKHLPSMVFSDSPNLQFLLLNANKLKCFTESSLGGLSKLNLLSLYDNRINTLPEGLFNSLTSIQTIHLGRNPLICNCKLRWLNNYLQKNPVEKSGVTCRLPKRLSKKSIGSISSTRFRCNKQWLKRYAENNICNGIMCPKECKCKGTIVDCRNKDLTRLPSNIPMHATQIHLQNNQIKEIKATGFFKRFKKLQRIDLRNNHISSIENRAFEGAISLTDLFLNENRLDELEPETFAGLDNLKILLLRTNMLNTIRNNTFNHLKSLRLLSLYDNKISCVQKGSLEDLHQLKTLNLMSNPLICNCQIKWLSDWLSINNLATGNLKCSFPTSLKGKSVTSLNTTIFSSCSLPDQSVCAASTSTDKIILKASISSCPQNCTCRNNIVRCSRANLKSLPADMISSVQELYMDSNELTEIPDYIKKLSNLEKLDLSFNKIRVIPMRIFETLTKLDTLIISFNKIQCIQKSSFAGLSKLRMLSLYGNDISTIPDGSFKDLKSLSHIALGLNPFVCDCHLAWLSTWIKNDYVEPGIARCQSPSSLANKLILTTPTYFFECSNSSGQPIHASKCNACYQNTCVNNSTCSAVDEDRSRFKCTCQPGFYGQLCDRKVNACYSEPCENGGTCNSSTGDEFQCQCRDGWTGERCEKSTQLLVENWCTSENANPCKNNANCLRFNKSFRCECGDGFEGKLCEKKIIRDCKNHKCQFGTCVEGDRGYTCICKNGFSGVHCDVMNPIAMPLVNKPTSEIEQTIGCTNNDCRNGGICYKLTVNGIPSKETFCKCQIGYGGAKCQILEAVQLDQSDSYLEFETPDLDKKFNITFSLITAADEGVLIYHGSRSKQHFVVELFKGRIRVSFDLGNTATSTLFSYAKVNDEKERRIEVLVNGQNVTLSLADFNEHRSVSNSGKFEHLTVGFEAVYVGGVPDSIKERITKQLQHVHNATSMRGCITRLYMNSELRDLQDIEYSHKVNEGCGNLNSCRIERCHGHGECKDIFTLKADFECTCKQGWMGEQCEIAEVNSKLEYRAMALSSKYNSNGQKSLLKIKHDDNNHQISINKLNPVSDRQHNGNCHGRMSQIFYTDPKTKCKSRKQIRHLTCSGKCNSASAVYRSLSNNFSDKTLFIGTNSKSVQTRSVDCCRSGKFRTRNIKLFCPDGSTMVTEIRVARRCVCSSTCEV